MSRQADLWRFTWPDCSGPEQRLVITVNSIREHSDGLSAEFEASYRKEALVGHIHGPVKLNLTSTVSQASLIRHLSDRVGSVLWAPDGRLTEVRPTSIRWAEVVEVVSATVTRQYRQGTPVVNLADLEEVEEVRYLVDRVMPLNQTTGLFSDGGVGKSILAELLAVLVASGKSWAGLRPTRKVPVLYLDWEVEEDEARRRLGWIARGLGLYELPDLYYRRMERSLADDVDRLRTEVARLGAGLVIVDSIAPATGGNPNDPEVTIRTMNAVRLLYPATRLILAHVSKTASQQDGAETSSPFGSVFYRNLCRSLWEMRAESTSTGLTGETTEIGLFHRKVNLGRKQLPMAFRFVWDDAGHSLKVTAARVTDSPEMARHSSVADQIRATLRDGSKTIEEIAASTGRRESVIRVTLGKMVDVVLLSGGRGRGKVGCYGLAADTDETPEAPPVDGPGDSADSAQLELEEESAAGMPEPAGNGADVPPPKMPKPMSWPQTPSPMPDHVSDDPAF